MTDGEEVSACLVFDASILVENLFEATRNGMERKDSFGKFLEARIKNARMIIILLSDNVHPCMKCSKCSKQFPKCLFFEVSAFNTNAMDFFSEVEEVLLWLFCEGLENVA